MTTTGSMVQGSGWSRRLHPFTWVMALLIAVVLIGDGVAFLVHGAGGYYAFSPGSAPTITASGLCRGPDGSGDLTLPNGTPCARLVVPAQFSHDIVGALYMVDVYVGPATPLDYLLDKLHVLNRFNDGMQLIPKADVLGSTPQSQLGCQDTQQMQSATSYASVVALRRLGYQVTEDDLGAQLYQIEPGSAAAVGGLQCSDIVTSIGGKAVRTADDLVAVLKTFKPGERVTVTANRVDAGGKAHPVSLSVKLGSTPALDGQPAKPSEAFLGVVAQDDTTYKFPFNVDIQVGDIGGPSAGLALTLGLLDILSGGNLTGGHRVAATGTISVDGSVGDVGGVAQKAVAVRKAGAQVFLVPPQELAAARSHAGGMKVYAVSTLDQALQYLKGLGGHIPAPSSSQNVPE